MLTLKTYVLFFITFIYLGRFVVGSTLDGLPKTGVEGSHKNPKVVSHVTMRRFMFYVSCTVGFKSCGFRSNGLAQLRDSPTFDFEYF